MKGNAKKYFAVTLQTVFLVLGLYFLGRVIRSNLYFPLIEPIKEVNSVLYDTLRTYFGHFIFLGLLLLYFCVADEEHHLLRCFRFHGKRDVLMVVIGLAAGFLMNGGSIFAAILHGDIDMVPAKFNFGLLVFTFFAVALQSSTEEFEYRLWGQNRIGEKAPLAWAVIGSAATFALCHMLNPGMSFISLLNLFLIGVLYSLLYHYTGSIWLPCAHHTAWNFTQNCIFGLPNSGNPASITIMQPTYTKASICYDPEFGVEGTVITTLIYVITIIIMIVLINKKGRN